MSNASISNELVQFGRDRNYGFNILFDMQNLFIFWPKSKQDILQRVFIAAIMLEVKGNRDAFMRGINMTERLYLDFGGKHPTQGYAPAQENTHAE